MSSSSRAVRATRVASAACTLVPSLLGLPLLAGAFLATLWLVGAAPAQADSLDLRGSTPLEEVVPGRVTDPVAATLGTVHQRLEERTGGTAEAVTALPEPARAVSEVGGEARRVVGEIDRTRLDTPGTGLVSGLTPDPVGDTVPDPDEEPGAEVGEAPAELPRVEASGAPAVPAAAVTGRLHAPTAAVAPAPADSGEGTGAAHTDAPGSHLAAGSAAPSSGGSSPAPGVAGYLTATSVAAPASDVVRLRADRLRAVPAGPADDPTVSPD